MNSDGASIEPILAAGGVGVFPTDTLYGVVASATSRESVERMYALKGRDENKPFIILIADSTDIEKFGVVLSPDQKAFLQTVWPGPVSVIVPCTDPAFTYLHRGTQSLAFRLPNEDGLRDFLRKTGPLVAPSANPQGLAPAHTIEEAKKYFADTVDFYMDEGIREGKPSKIISLVSGEPVIIRN